MSDTEEPTPSASATVPATYSVCPPQPHDQAIPETVEQPARLEERHREAIQILWDTRPNSKKGRIAHIRRRRASIDDAIPDPASQDGDDVYKFL